MSLTTVQQISIGRICGLLASNEINSGKKQGGQIDLRLPFLLNAVTTGLEWLYQLDPADPDLEPIGNYLISICRFGPKAEYLLSVGGGGVVTTITPDLNIFPFVITSADFEADGISYNNPDIVGVTLAIFVNEYAQQFYTSGTFTFLYTGQGIQITLPGFNANSNTYTIRIEKLGNG